MSDKKEKTGTKLTKLSRVPKDQEGFINPPIYKGSTIIYPDVASLQTLNHEFNYGRHGTPTTRALETALSELEHGFDTKLTESGLSAITLVISAFAAKGAHILASDTVYAPTRLALDRQFKQYGVSISYFDPYIASDIGNLIRDETCLIICESPGSLTMEVHDLPAICKEAKKKGVPVAVDNTWASPLFYSPLKLGADISIHSGAKYILGHSDGFFGSVTATKEYFPAISDARRLLGHCASPEEAHMGLRGLRTLGVRMKEHLATGLKLAGWFEAQDYVDEVLHPALPSSPDHNIWKRDFTGAGGLFSVIFKPETSGKLDQIINSLSHFGIGFSYGGFESLVLPFDPKPIRSATKWDKGPAVRFYAGLEDQDDLLADLKHAFRTLS